MLPVGRRSSRLSDRRRRGKRAPAYVAGASGVPQRITILSAFALVLLRSSRPLAMSATSLCALVRVASSSGSFALAGARCLTYVSDLQGMDPQHLIFFIVCSAALPSQALVGRDRAVIGPCCGALFQASTLLSSLTSSYAQRTAQRRLSSRSCILRDVSRSRRGSPRRRWPASKLQIVNDDVVGELIATPCSASRGSSWCPSRSSSFPSKAWKRGVGVPLRGDMSPDVTSFSPGSRGDHIYAPRAASGPSSSPGTAGPGFEAFRARFGEASLPWRALVARPVLQRSRRRDHVPHHGDSMDGQRRLPRRRRRQG